MLPCYHERVLCLSIVDDFGNNVASALSDSKYIRMPLAHALPFIM